MPDIFETGTSGLLAFQRAMATTSHNISNVNTEGFSRQSVELATRTPQAFGNGFIGSGVQVTSVQRVFDQAREEGVWRASSAFQRLDTLSEMNGRLDDLLADQTAGLSPVLQGFFDSVQSVANDPVSSTARQELLTEGTNLAQRVRFLDDRLVEVDSDSQAQMRVQVAEINELAESVARLNEAIVAEQGRANGQPPNDLLDQRDVLVRNISERLATRTVTQDDGSMNVFVGNGQVLVAGLRSNELQVVAGREDPNEPRIAFVEAGGATTDVTRNLQGGSLGGLLEFREDVLNPTRDDLGRITASLVQAFNAQHHLGMQFDGGAAGALGGDFFRMGTPEVVTAPANTGAGAPAVAFDPAAVGELTGDNYRMAFDGSVWNITRASDASAVASIAPGAAASFEGITVDTSSIAGAAAGDRFVLRPTRSLARSVDVVPTRPAQVAAAAPLTAGEATDARGNGVNTGTATIGSLEVRSTANLPPAAGVEPFTLTFDAAAGLYRATDTAGNALGTIAYDPLTDAGGITVDAASPRFTPAGPPSLTDFGDLRFELAGAPADGDALVIARNRDGLGDNANMLRLGNLADTSVLDRGNATLQESYSGLVGEVGTAALRANVTRDAQQTVLNQAVQSREEVSGVNLDEEAANLLRFQQAYQASAQVLSTANNLFDTLLAAIRR